MKDEIILSEKHGLNPSMVLCPTCLKKTNTIALFGKLKNDAEAPKQIIGNELCDKCKEKIKEGFVAIIEIENDKRTGRMMWVKRHILNVPKETNYCFTEKKEGVIDELLKVYKDIIVKENKP